MFDFKSLLNIYVPDEFGCDEDSYPTKSIDEVFAQLPDNVETHWGVSQFCIIPADSDMVAKIPFSGEFYTVEEETLDEDGNEKILENTGFNYFHTNYCDLSYDLYLDAEDQGLESILAKMEFLGQTKNGVNVYLQEKVLPLDRDTTIGRYFKSKEERESSSKRLKEVRKKYDNTSIDWYHFPTNWAAAALDFYGEAFMVKFIKFIEENELNDFHDGNIGWREKDNTPVILDWAGYNG